MDNISRKTLGRGKALQSVMSQSKASLNVNEMHMANYTNEKIMEFLETISERYTLGPSVQNVQSRNLKPAGDGEVDEICLSLPEDVQSKNTEQTTSTQARIEPKDHFLHNIIPGQFTFNDSDFPPL